MYYIYFLDYLWRFSSICIHPVFKLRLLSWLLSSSIFLLVLFVDFLFD